MLKKRKTNYELLRIIAMAMIVMHHICVHCIYPELTDMRLIELYKNGYYVEPVFFPRLILLEFPATFGKIGDVIFLLISGYFLIEITDCKKINRIIYKVISRAFFALIVLMVLSEMSRLFLYQDAFMVSFDVFYNDWWFIGYYILVTTLGIAFFNRFVNGISKSEYFSIILVTLILMNLNWPGKLIEDYVFFRQLIGGVCVYLIGGFFRKYKPLVNVKVYKLLVIILVVYIIVIISYYYNTVNIITDYTCGKQQLVFYQECSYYDDYNAVPVIIGVCLFEIFRRIDIGASRIIGGIADSTFFVYLLHENYLFRTLLIKIDWITDIHGNILIFFLRQVEILFLLFVAGIVTNIVFKTLNKGFKKITY